MKKQAIAHGEPFLEGDVANYQNISAYLQQSVKCWSDSKIFSLQIDSEIPIIQTYTQLWHRATCILGGMRKKRVKPGQFIIVILDECQDFVAVLWSCWMGGFVPIPIRFSANHSQPNLAKLRIKNVLQTISQPVVLTTEKLAEILEKDEVFQYEFTLIQLEEVETAPSNENFYQSNPEDLGALFFSSGTTGKPKLVSLSCQAIVKKLIQDQELNPETITSLFWLPLDHASASLRIANPNVQNKIFLPTSAFLLNPLRWLDVIEQYRVTITSITNFGMALVAHSVNSAGHGHWNLQSIKSIGIGAEAIMPQTYQAFIKSLMPFGLDPDVIYTGYGLTECGTVVSGKASWINFPNNDNQYMQLGRPCRGYSLRIINEQGSVINEGEIGQVQVIGPSTTKGYYDDPQATQALFSDDGWMNTGDLGLIQEGNLIITGRIKEIIIINAKNYACQEIEQVVNSLAEIDASATIACGIRPPESTTDDLAIFFSPNSTAIAKNTLDQEQQIIKLINKIRLIVATQLNITPTYVIPIAKNTIPRTVFGKVKRKKLAEKIQKGEFDHLIHKLEKLAQEELQAKFVAPKTETEKAMVKIWSKVFRYQHIGVQDNFFDLGGNSLLSAKLVAEIEKEFKQKLPLEVLVKLGTIADIAKILEQENPAEANLETTTIVKQENTLNQEIYHKILAYTAGWKGERINPNSLLFGHNLNGTKQPLFWCLQGYRELSQLAKYLGEEQPVYGMRSLHLVTEYSEENLKTLATHYVSEILKVQPDGAFLIGGNCQSSLIATEIALQLINKGKNITLLSLLENRKTQTYPGKIALFFGRDSEFNPYKFFRNPEIGWRKLYPFGFSVDLIPCDHGQYFDEPNINIFVEKLRYAIESAQKEMGEQLLPEKAYRAEITTINSLKIQVKEKLLISVKVKNISPVTWLASENSGIMLGNHWLDKNGEVIQWADARVSLLGKIEPGSTVTLDLLVTIPEKSGQYQLELDLVEEGITWFKDKGSQTTLVDLEVLKNAESIKTKQGENEIREKQLSSINLDQDIYRKQGDVAFEKGDFETALTNYQQAIKLNAQQPIEVYEKLGDALTQQQQLLTALTVYQKVIEKAPENDSIYFRIGKVYHQLKQWEQAVSYYQKARKIKEEQPFELFQKLGQAQEKLEDLKAAIAAYQKAIELQQNNANIYVSLASCLSQNGNKVDLPTPNPSQEGKEAAINNWEKVIELSPDNLGAYLNLGNLFTEVGEFDKAHKTYDLALKMSGNNAQVYVNLGNLYRQEKDFDQAITAYSKALEIDKKHRGARLNLVTLLNQQQRYLEALEICLESVKIDPENPHFYRQLGNIQRQIGELETAINSYNKAIELNPTCYNTHLLKGETFKQLGKLEKAIETYNKAQNLQPEKTRAYLSLGNTYWQQKDVSKAIESYQKAIEIDPKQPFMVYKNLGDAFNKQGKKDDAITAYSSALKLEPQNENVRRILENLKES